MVITSVLHCNPARAQPLAHLIHAKTGGNPFFMTQFLRELDESRLIVFDAQARLWRWNLASIETKSLTANVAEMMAEKVRRLPMDTRVALERAACIGHTCDVRILAAVLELSESEVRGHLAEAVTEGLLVRTGTFYSFVHDRIQEAALALVADDQRSVQHLRIGRLLLAYTPPHQLSRKLFEIVDHLNRGCLDGSADACHSTTDWSERLRLAEMNLVAGRKAKSQAAYDAAATYFGAGTALLGLGDPGGGASATIPSAWECRYRLTFDLHLERAHCEYLRGALEAAESQLEALRLQSRTAVDGAAVARVRIALHTTRGEMDKAIICGIESLHPLGVRLPAFPSRDQVDVAFEEVWQLLSRRSIESLIDLPAMADIELRMVIDLLSDLNTPAIFGRRNLLNLTLARMVTLTITHGLTDASVWAFTWFGATLVQRDFGRYRDGYRFGKLGYALMERNALHGFRAKVSLVFGDLINFYVHNIAEDRAYIEAAFQAATEVGDMPWACYSCNHILTNMLEVGDPLDTVWAESVRRLDFVRKAGDPNIEDIIISQQRFIQAMRGRTRCPADFDAVDFDQSAFEARIEGSEMPLMVCWYYILKLQVKVFYGESAEALMALHRARALIGSCGPDIQGLDYEFFAALAEAAQFLQVAPEVSEALASSLAAIDGHLTLLGDWADSCPANFRHRFCLVAAERARLVGADLEAQRLYEEAIQAAEVNGFGHYQALAFELAGRFYRLRGFALIADTYVQQAIRFYRNWGADGKVRQLQVQCSPVGIADAEAPTGTDFVAPAEQLDLLSVVKAAQSISGELELPRLQEALLRIALEQAGASRGVLMLAGGGTLRIRARAETDGASGSIRVWVGPAEEVTEERVPSAVLAYVRRTRLPVVLPSASVNLLDDDSGIRGPVARSRLCLPIVREGQLIGVLYLENDLLAGAFTTRTLAALELLASQAAITLETATISAERQRAEVALRDQLHFTERLIETMPTPLFYKDEAGVYTGCNRAFEEVIGLPRDQVVGKTVYQLWPKDIAQVYAKADEELFAHPGTQVYESVFAFADGSLHSVVFHKATLYRADGSVSGLVGVVWDVTERRQAAIAMAKAKETAEAASLAKSRFLAAASHDMRQPFQAIQLYHDLLMRHLSLPRQQDLGLRLGEAIAAGNDLLNALFEASVLDSGTIRPEITALALAPLLARLAGELVEQAAAKGLTLRWVPCHATIRSDPVLLLQVLRNLLINAIRYTHRGRILLGCRRRGASGISIEVWDTGIGIPEEKLDLVFEDFFQIGNPERQRAKGFGLGLAIARRTAKLLGHTLTVQSKLHRGSGFVVLVPGGVDTVPAADPTQDCGAIPHNPMPEVSMSHTTDAPQILVIDDEPLLLNALRMMLEDQKYRVLAVNGSAAALDVVANGGIGPLALILSDYRLPGPLSGVDTIVAVRQALGCTVPAILITGNTELPAGPVPDTDALLILHKPVSSDVLYRTIAAMIAGGERRR